MRTHAWRATDRRQRPSPGSPRAAPEGVQHRRPGQREGAGEQQGEDRGRFLNAVRSTAGKRLMYKTLVGGRADYVKKGTRASAAPPATTDAIWPAVLAPAACMIR